MHTVYKKTARGKHSSVLRDAAIEGAYETSPQHFFDDRDLATTDLSTYKK